MNPMWKTKWLSRTRWMLSAGDRVLPTSAVRSACGRWFLFIVPSLETDQTVQLLYLVARNPG